MSYVIAATVFLLFIWATHKFLTTLVLPPSHFPKNIPTIPFYYTLIPLLREVDQEDLYRRYLEKPLTEYGAVKMFFGGHWNVLITRPAYMAQVLKHDEVFAKAGNHVKNPHSVLALYTGENIISSTDDTWRYFASLVKPGLQADVDSTVIGRNADKLIQLLLQQQDDAGSVEVRDHIQAYAIENVSETLLGSSFGTLENPDARMTKLQSDIKPKIFNPFFLNFPMLDHYKIPGREEARRLVRAFKAELSASIIQRHKHIHDGLSNNKLGCALVSAYEKGQLSEYHFQQNCLITFVAGHENPQNLIMSTLFVFAERQDLQDRAREEIMKLSPADRRNLAILSNLPVLNSIIYETLRLYPPLSQIMNKRTTTDTWLGGKILLMAGTYTGYNGYSTNRNREFWGPDANDFRPSRWGETMEEISSLLRRATSKATFITFHGGKRACIGQKWAMTTHRLTMALFLSSVRWRLDPTWPRKMTPAGPLMPKNLRLQFEKLDSSAEDLVARPMAEKSEMVDAKL